MRKFLCALALLLPALLPPPVLAQAGADAPAEAARPPFAYVLRQTTLEDARQYWSQNGATVLGGGHLALGFGRGMDGMSKLWLDKVLLVDVSGVDFEGIPIVRFGFYENRLYLIQATLKSGFTRKNGASQEYTAAQLKDLEARLRQKYGKPAEALHTMFADKGKNDVLVWRIDGNKLTFTSNPLNGGLTLSNDRIEAEVKKQIREYCKTVDAKERAQCAR